MKTAFRYSGNKAKLINLYRLPDKKYNHIVEPYLGSGSFLMNTDIPGTGYEINKDLYDMWKWLQTSSELDLIRLNQYVESIKKEADKVDIRTLDLDYGAMIYLKINICSVMVGQMSSWKIYNKHNLPIDKTIRCLDRIKEVDILNQSGEEHIDSGNELIFLDPPYIGTNGNYIDAKRKNINNIYSPQNTIDFINKCTSPIIFTYGTNAESIFPMYKWELVKEVKVPNIKMGGTVTRKEMVSYINY